MMELLSQMSLQVINGRHCLNHDAAYGAAVIIKSRIISRVITPQSSNKVISIEIDTNLGTFKAYSIYCRPTESNVSNILAPIRNVESNITKKLLLCMDSNAHNTLWNSPFTDDKGKELEDIINNSPVSILNVDSKKYINSIGTTHIDITLAGDNIYRTIKDWRYLDILSLSDHQYIIFDITLMKPKRRKYR